MRSQPNRDYVSNDDVQTPLKLARQIVAHFQPSGRILEPCKGEGHFLRALREQAKNRGAGAGGSGSKASAQIEPNPPRSLRLASSVHWTELKRGRDFFAWNEPVDWIITNPPWSQIRKFLQHAMQHAQNVVFLLTVNHLWTKARLRDIREAGFGLREILLVDMPPTFPQSGFQLGAIYLQRGWRGPITLTDIGAH